MERAKAVAIDEENESNGQQELLGQKVRRGLKGGTCTPVPPWKFQDLDPEGMDGVRKSEVSARKLGAGLWEVQDVLPLSRMSRRVDRVRRDRMIDQPQSAGSLRRHEVTSSAKHRNLNEKYSTALQPASPSTYSSSIEVAAFNHAASPSRSLDLKGKLRESGYSIKTSTELLKVLNRIWSLEEQHASSKSQVKALIVELEHARARIKELLQEQQTYRSEMDDLINHVAEDKVTRKNKERDRTKVAIKSIREELEDERRLRRQSESLHRKLGKELSEVKSSYSKALKNLESERKANSLLEDLCDEFAKGVRDYEHEVRELKQKAAIDYERKTDGLVLHISEAWLDERLQLRFAEAQGDVAEKSTILNRLSSEVTTFLQARLSTSSKSDVADQTDGVLRRQSWSDVAGQTDGVLRRQSRESVHLNGAASAPRDAEDDDSVASDLHCFELNMNSDNNESHGHRNSHCEDGREKPESSRKSNFTRKETGYSVKNKGQSSSSLDMQSGTMQGVHRHIDAITSGIESNHINFVMPRESENFHAQEGDRKLKWVAMQPTDKIQSELYEGSKVHHNNHRGDDSHSRFSWRGRFSPIREDNASADFPALSSRWNYRHASPGPECSSSLSKGVKENTLKAKLLEARLEGQHARFKVSKGSSVG